MPLAAGMPFRAIPEGVPSLVVPEGTLRMPRIPVELQGLVADTLIPLPSLVPSMPQPVAWLWFLPFLWYPTDFRLVMPPSPVPGEKAISVVVPCDAPALPESSSIPPTSGALACAFPIPHLAMSLLPRIPVLVPEYLGPDALPIPAVRKHFPCAAGVPNSFPAPIP